MLEKCFAGVTLKNSTKNLASSQYTKTPFYGPRRMREALERKGYKVKRKRVQRLMGIEAIYPKRNLSKPSPGHKIYPYLLREREISRVSSGYGLDEPLCTLLGAIHYMPIISPSEKSRLFNF
jgi:putative transposase